MDCATQASEPTLENPETAPTEAEASVQTDKPKPIVAVPLPLEQKYLLMAMDARRDKVLLSLRSQLERKYAILMMEEFSQLVKVNADARTAIEAYDKALNSTILGIEETLPEGYAVVELKVEQGMAVTAYAPAQRGQRRFAV